MLLDPRDNLRPLLLAVALILALVALLMAGSQAEGEVTKTIGGFLRDGRWI